MRSHDKFQGYGILQPVNLTIVGEFVDELVNHTVNAYRATNKIKRSIQGIVEDEVISVELCETASADTTSQLDIVSQLKVCIFVTRPTVGT
jgi:hypothetical protein